MASKAGESGLKTVDDDLIHCPICFDMFDNPRSMPCLHTYCYKCLDRLCRDKNPGGDSVDCPICRKECNIPSEGVAGFAHNFFIQRMVDGKRRNAPQKGVVLCEVCVDENQSATATKYCIDCRLRLCERCNRLHHRMNSGNHRIRETGTELERELVQLASSFCVKHTNEMHRLYCFTCNCNVCISCVSKKHPKHDLQDIETVATNFRSQMSADVVAVKKLLDETERQNQRQKSALNEFCERIALVVSAVDKQCKDILSYFETVVNKEKQKILQELKLAKEKALKVFSEYEERTSLSVVSMTSFINYSEELRKKGNAYDITRAGSDSHKRASEILAEHPVSRTYNGPAVEFRAENVSKIFASVVESGIVGRLVKTDDDGAEDTDAAGFMNRAWRLKPQTSAAQPAAPAAVSTMQHNDDSSRSSVSMTCADAHVIAPREDRNGSVIGLTVYGDELFIVRWKPKDHIEVYSASTFTFKHNIKVKELERSVWCRGLTSCDSNNCLYVSYCCDGDRYIARVELTGDNEVFEWKVNAVKKKLLDLFSSGYESIGLSVNSEHNLIVTCNGWMSNKLIEYTTRGELVREILLQGDIKYLHHAIQLNRSQYLVCHGSGAYSLHRVCVVDANGRVLLSYGNKQGAESEQLNYPCQLAVDRNGFIFVADCNNNRIVVLDSKLKWSHDLNIDGGSVVKKPYSLYLDENRNLLLVGEGDGDASRVVIVTV